MAWREWLLLWTGPGLLAGITTGYSPRSHWPRGSELPASGAAASRRGPILRDPGPPDRCRRATRFTAPTGRAGRWPLLRSSLTRLEEPDRLAHVGKLVVCCRCSTIL